MIPDEVAKPIDTVLQCRGAVVGVTCVGDYRDDPSPEVGELWAMYVHPDYWGAGAGTLLMQATIDEFTRSNRSIGYLWVFAENVRGRSFHEAMGCHRWNRRVGMARGSQRGRAQPLIVFHSREDTIVPFVSAEEFCKAATDCELVPFDEGDHGFFNDEPAFTATTNGMIGFLEANGW